MSLRITVLIATFLCITFSSIGQGISLLKTISEGAPNSLSGLGSTFFGNNIGGKNLYFKGSKDGLKDAIWVTDGTISGTQKLIEESNTFGGNWGRFIFLDDAVLIQLDDEWYGLYPDDPTPEPIPGLPAESIKNIVTNTDGLTYVTTERDGNQILHVKIDNGFSELGVFHPDQPQLTLTAGTMGAVIFNDNPFVDDYPKLYLRQSNEMVDMNDYLSQWFTITTFDYAYIHDKYMITYFTDGDNFFSGYIIDMETETFEEFPFIREPVSYNYFEDNIFLVSKRDVIQINTNDMSSTILYDEVFSFTTSLRHEDKLYINGSHDDILITEIDMTTGIAKELPDSFTGNSLYNNKFEIYKDEFYYISKSTHSILHKYDFVDETSITIDTLSTHTGATVDHALVTVGDHLVISKRPNPIGHELYVYNAELNSVTNLSYTDLDAVPTLSSDFIELRQEGISFDKNTSTIIIDKNGKMYDSAEIRNGQIDIANYPSGMYFGIIEFGNELFRYTFIKH